MPTVVFVTTVFWTNPQTAQVRFMWRWYCIQGIFRSVLFSPFFNCIQLRPVLNSFKFRCVNRNIFCGIEFGQTMSLQFARWKWGRRDETKTRANISLFTVVNLFFLKTPWVSIFILNKYQYLYTLFFEPKSEHLILLKKLLYLKHDTITFFALSLQINFSYKNGKCIKINVQI